MTEPTLHDTQAGFTPAEGQAFYFTSKPPAKPAPRKGWLLPLLGSLLMVPLLMFGFGLSQQQQPTAATPSPSPSTTPASTESPSSIPSPVPSPEATAQPQTTERQVAAASIALQDTPALAVASVRCPSVIANFRIAPSLHSLVQDVIADGALVETTNRRVSQDGVIWQEVRYRKQMGWVASNFIGGQSHANF